MHTVHARRCMYVSLPVWWRTMRQDAPKSRKRAIRSVGTRQRKRCAAEARCARGRGPTPAGNDFLSFLSVSLSSGRSAQSEPLRAMSHVGYCQLRRLRGRNFSALRGAGDQPTSHRCCCYTTPDPPGQCRVLPDPDDPKSSVTDDGTPLRLLVRAGADIASGRSPTQNARSRA